MAFIVENNLGLSDASAYVTVEEFTVYALSVGVDVTDKTDTELEQLITDTTYNFIDTRYTPTDDPLNSEQALQWPTSSQLINDKFKRAVCEACLLNYNGLLFVEQDANGRIKSTTSKLDVLEKSVEYQDAPSANKLYYPTAQIDKLMSAFSVAVGGVSFGRWV